LVVCLHLAVFYAFLFGLQVPFIKENKQPSENRALPSTRPADLPAVPQPDLSRVMFDFLTREVFLPAAPNASPEVPPELTDGASPPQSSTVPAMPGLESPAHVAAHVQGGPGGGFPNADDYYPSLSRFKAEQGAAIVSVCVDPMGRLTAEPTTFESTGSARLDEGALRLARAGSGYYRPTTEDGKPVISCYPFRVRFQLKN
jgi:TonB family protein